MFKHLAALAMSAYLLLPLPARASSQATYAAFNPEDCYTTTELNAAICKHIEEKDQKAVDETAGSADGDVLAEVVAKIDELSSIQTMIDSGNGKVLFYNDDKMRLISSGVFNAPNHAFLIPECEDDICREETTAKVNQFLAVWNKKYSDGSSIVQNGEDLKFFMEGGIPREIIYKSDICQDLSELESLAELGIDEVKRIEEQFPSVANSAKDILSVKSDPRFKELSAIRNQHGVAIFSSVEEVLEVYDSHHAVVDIQKAASHVNGNGEPLVQNVDDLSVILKCNNVLFYTSQQFANGELAFDTLEEVHWASQRKLTEGDLDYLLGLSSQTGGAIVDTFEDLELIYSFQESNFPIEAYLNLKDTRGKALIYGSSDLELLSKVPLPYIASITKAIKSINQEKPVRIDAKQIYDLHAAGVDLADIAAVKSFKTPIELALAIKRLPGDQLLEFANSYQKIKRLAGHDQILNFASDFLNKYTAASGRWNLDYADECISDVANFFSMRVNESENRIELIDSLAPESVYRIISNGEELYTSTFNMLFEKIRGHDITKHDSDELASFLFTVNRFNRFTDLVTTENKQQLYDLAIEQGTKNQKSAFFMASLYSSLSSDLDFEKKLVEAYGDTSEIKRAVYGIPLAVNKTKLKTAEAQKIAEKSIDEYGLDEKVSDFEALVERLPDETVNTFHSYVVFNDEGDEVGFKHLEWFGGSLRKEGYKQVKSDTELVYQKQSNGILVKYTLVKRDDVDIHEVLSDTHVDLVAHRGHSYQVRRTFPNYAEVKGNKIIMLGSCNGYTEVPNLESSYGQRPFISTQNVGHGAINNAILIEIGNAAASKSDEWSVIKSKVGRRIPESFRRSFVDYTFPDSLGLLILEHYQGY